jgi:hypothetical protein
MARTSHKARKSTGGTAPRKTGVALHPPAAVDNVLVTQQRRRQVSIFVYTLMSISYIFCRNIVIFALTAVTSGCVIDAPGLCVLNIFPCPRAPIFVILYTFALRAIYKSCLDPYRIS